MNDFLLLKLNRAIWLSLLEQRKLLEAVSYFEIYIDSFTGLKKDKKLQTVINKEIEYSQKLFTDKFTVLAADFYNKRDFANALICYTAIFKYRQDDIEIIKNYAACLEELKIYDLETDIAQYLKTLRPQDNSVNKTLAGIYANRDDHKNAILYMEKYIDMKASDVTAEEYNLLGCYYNKYYTDVTHNFDDIIKSLVNFKKAADIEPSNTVFLKNATIMAGKADDRETCGKYWKKLLETGNLTNDDKYDYAAFCLRNEDFENWHKYFGARFAKENNATAFPKIKKPEWTGKQNIKNSTLLIHYEQGYGDMLLAFGYMPGIVPLAKHVIFVVQDSLFELLKNNPYGIEVLPAGCTDLSKLEFDYFIPAMSIPAALNLNRDTISAGAGYVKADTKLVNEYKEKYFNNTKFKIGIAFSGIVTGNHFRDIPVRELLPFDDLKNAELYCLTKDIPDENFKCFKHNKVVNIAKSFKNFADTAAAIENCNIIVTSDNCILNLAGALGKKTFGLFNRCYEFRWFDLTGDNVVWYNSVKPFVNDKIDNWSSSVCKVIKEIKNLQQFCNMKNK